MSKVKKIVALSCISIGIISVILCSILHTSHEAYAADQQLESIGNLVKKAQYNGLKSICYNNNDGFIQTIPGADTQYQALRNIVVQKNPQYIFLPGYSTGVNANNKDDVDRNYRGYLSVNCKELLIGKTNLRRLDIKPFSGIADKDKTYDVTTIGYKAVQYNQDQQRRCFSLSYQELINNQYIEESTTNTLCVPVINDGDQLLLDWDAINAGEITESSSSKKGNGGLSVAYDSDGGPIHFNVKGVRTGGSQHICNIFECNSWSDFQNALDRAIQELNGKKDGQGTSYYKNVNSFETNSDNVSDQTTASVSTLGYELEPKNVASLAALRTFTGNPEAQFSDYAFTPTDWAFLYQYYVSAIEDSDNKTALTTDVNNCSATKPSSGYALTKDNGKTWCTLDADKIESISGVFTIRKDDRSLKAGSFADVIKAMMALDYSKVDEDKLNSLINGNGDGSTPADGEGDDAAASCFTDGDALGWIICPVLKMAGSAAAATYENILTNWLRMDVTFFSTKGDNSGTYTGWSQFRDLANIVFAIFFVVVILAQVTGIGISNYNIKKILPKLIVVVILVNASFIICQLAVDLSNIIGASAYDMLISLPTGNGEGFGLDNLIGGMLGTIGTALIGGTAITAGVVAAISNPGAVLIPLLLAILSALIGLLFFFIILAIRKAGVIVLVVLAPLAIVCYALPNTKSLFDKWKKLFSALLLVYPICSILMGGGYFVSNLMLKSSDNGFVESLVAMLLQIIPIFFVPTILRSSLAIAGNIGAKISSFGTRLSGRATGALRSSDAVQRFNTSMNYWGATKGQKAVGAIGRGVGRIPGVGRIQRSRLGRAISAGHNRNVARSMVNYEKMRLDEGNNQFIAESMTPESIQQALDTQQFEQEQRLINNAAQSISAGSASYTDALGNSQKINVNDLASSSVHSLSSAFQSLRSQYDASGGTDRQIGNQMNAIAKTMISRYGDKGRSLVMESLKGDADSTGTFNRTASFNSLSNYISRDEKWMSALKKEDPGAFEMISDGANATGAMRNLQAYNSAGSSKVTASSVPNLSEDFFTGYEKAINNAKQAGVFSTSSAANTQQITDFEKMVQSFEQAAADPIISRSIKDGDLAYINNINKALYEAKRDGWKSNNPGKTDADYAAQFGNYRDIAIGQSVKISHKQMPTGWHRATTAEAITHGARVGFSEGDWIDGSGSTPTRLSTADQKRAEAIEDYNIKADLNNNP